MGADAIRLLIVEDSANDAALLLAELKHKGQTTAHQRVETKEEFQAALEKGGFDLIIADYFLPGFDGITAVQQARDRLPETPVLLVSGTIGEAAAVESLKAGATDYVLKHWPERLIPAVNCVR